MSRNLLKIGFIGGGKMAKALASGFISSGLTNGENMIASFHPADKHLVQNFEQFGAKAVFENLTVFEHSDLVVVAVKPSVVPTALGDVKEAVVRNNKKLFLSLAMGVTTKQVEMCLSPDARVIRVMPNTPALVQSGASVFVRGTNATDQDVSLTKRLLNSVGTCEEVPEKLLDAVTALSGSGPAYVYVFIESLADGAVKMGMPRDLAYRLAAQTVVGAGKMVRETRMHPAALKDDVTSPGGSTAAALHHLEKNNFRSAVIGAIEAATNRCLQVSQAPTK